VFWRRGAWHAAMATLISGFVLGATVILVDLPVVGTQKLVTQVWGIPFMLQAWWLFCICSVIFCTTSLLTPAPPAAQVDGLTWSRPMSPLRFQQASPGDPKTIARYLLSVIAILYTWLRQAGYRSHRFGR